MDTSRNWNAWLVCVAFVTTNASAQVFSHKHRGEHFEATVTAERIVVKERYKGATSIDGDLSCPLGSAVRANLLPSAESKLCLTFSAEECGYTRYQNGAAVHRDELAHARMPKMCIVLASEKDARRLVNLVNAGPQLNGQAVEVAAAEPLPQLAATADMPLPEAPKRVSAKAASTAQQVQMPAGSTQIVEERTHSYSSSGAPPDSSRTNGTKQNLRNAPVTLFVHVRNPAQRAHIERLVKPLAAQGIRVIGIRVLGTGPAETDLRYFYAGDANNTTQVVRVLRKLGVPEVRVKHIAGFETRATPRQYELWIGPPEEAVPVRRPPPRLKNGRQHLARG